jgi:hypothetical protein
MKLEVTEYHPNGRYCVKGTAYISRSKKNGIPSTRQKTWKIYPALKTKPSEVRPLFMVEAQRWRAKLMAEWFPSGVPEVAAKEMELI